MNSEGKEQVIRNVANVIIIMFHKHIEEPIRLRWKIERNEQTFTYMEKTELDKKKKK
jgi:hypothetical protein